MSRTRLIRPTYFSDELVATLTLSTRLVYIGLWTQCDDAGYFDRKPAEIAVALFPYERPAARVRRVEQALGQLVEAERVRWLECGKHGVVPKLPEHGVIRGGNHSYNVKFKHDQDCALTLFRARQIPAKRSENSGVRTGRDESVSVSVSGTDSESGSFSGSGRGAPRGLEKSDAVARRLVAGLR